jgi:hypothetical protein
MALEQLGQEISPGTFYLRIYEARAEVQARGVREEAQERGVRIDRFIVRPGATVPFHGNAQDAGYKLVACTRLKFVSLSEDGRINEFRQMEPGEVLSRPRGFRHTLINTSDTDFVVLKVWPAE